MTRPERDTLLDPSLRLDPELPLDPGLPLDPDLPLVLASASPRRDRLLREAGLRFRIVPADLDETPLDGEAPGDSLWRLAREKALAVARGCAAEDFVLGADTGVILDGVLYGKPRDPEHAVEMLRTLTGRTHEVTTAFAIARGTGARIWQGALTSRVTLRPAERAELAAYVATGEPLDKAGAYAFQGEGRRFVERVDGSESNVIGLPVAETLALLARAQQESRSDAKPSEGKR